jgi:hypothetical protein
MGREAHGVHPGGDRQAGVLAGDGHRRLPPWWWHGCRRPRRPTNRHAGAFGGAVGAVGHVVALPRAVIHRRHAVEGIVAEVTAAGVTPVFFGVATAAGSS